MSHKAIRLPKDLAKNLALLKVVTSNSEQLTPKLELAVWRLKEHFNTPLATPTCCVKTRGG